MPTHPTLSKHRDYEFACAEARDRLEARGFPTTPGLVSTVAQRLLIDQLRKHGREQLTGGEAELARVADARVDVQASEREALRRLEQQRVMALWERERVRLAPARARAFELFVLEGCNADETACALVREGLADAPVRGELVRQWVHRVLVTLRSLANTGGA